jgi:hypothetical protein
VGRDNFTFIYHGQNPESEEPKLLEHWLLLPLAGHNRTKAVPSSISDRGNKGSTECFIYHHTEHSSFITTESLHLPEHPMISAMLISDKNTLQQTITEKGLYIRCNTSEFRHTHLIGMHFVNRASSITQRNTLHRTYIHCSCNTVSKCSAIALYVYLK